MDDKKESGQPGNRELSADGIIDFLSIFSRELRVSITKLHECMKHFEQLKLNEDQQDRLKESKSAVESLLDLLDSGPVRSIDEILQSARKEESLGEIQRGKIKKVLAELLSGESAGGVNRKEALDNHEIEEEFHDPDDRETGKREYSSTLTFLTEVIGLDLDSAKDLLRELIQLCLECLDEIENAAKRADWESLKQNIRIIIAAAGHHSLQSIIAKAGLIRFAALSDNRKDLYLYIKYLQVHLNFFLEMVNDTY